MSSRPPACRPPACYARAVGRGMATQQTALSGHRTSHLTLVPKQRLPKQRRQKRRNKRRRCRRSNRLPASDSCLLPVGLAAPRDGGGGHRAREHRAGNLVIERYGGVWGSEGGRGREKKERDGCWLTLGDK